MIERRRYVRVKSSHPVRLYRSEWDGGQDALNIDISEGGAKIRASKAVPLHAAMRLEMDLPGSPRTIRAEGQAVWIRMISEGDCEIGVSFDSLDDRDRSTIRSFVQTVIMGRFPKP